MALISERELCWCGGERKFCCGFELTGLLVSLDDLDHGAQALQPIRSRRLRGAQNGLAPQAFLLIPVGRRGSLSGHVNLSNGERNVNLLLDEKHGLT